ncbi:MAG TPA: class A beta-lactamase-related serine hydrolase [Blastocatellia bacterium]|nr:class A beta-lactamase-related serine hydrolase [Blastocatellia bacterium]HMV84531.1 class A beta-lactamase-related serine hydrolase [Blastocatellia bacterium]HMX27774.1 class A beta-lactamase-related serine hydrolase [Blastocatellia bacterium]HMY76096.1 class A beta-lactamase-related serine hydrolase [Blastocatellia bacterium]HMZ17321.1 class A beta-lactamase-related serine hydrolase [Blastocatellia bacterium]
MSSHRFVSLIVFVSLLSLPVWGQSAKPSPQMDRLRVHLQELVNAFPGTMGVAVRDITTGQTISINGDRQFPMASAYKIPILVEVFRQAEAKKFSLDDRVQLAESDRTLGSGILTLMSPGLSPTIKDLATLMIILSDNQATDILLNKVGAENVTATMRSFGLKNIRVDRTTFEMIRDYLALMDDNAAGKSKDYLMNRPRLDTATPARVAQADAAFAKIEKDVASPLDMAQLLELIVKGKAAGEDSCRQMMTILNRQQFNHRLPRYLPEGVGFAHKTGTIGSTTNDAGVMFVRGNPIALVVFTVDKRTGRGEVEEQMGRLARVVYDFFDAVK